MGSNRSVIPLAMTSVITPEGYRTRRRRTPSLTLSSHVPVGPAAQLSVRIPLPTVCGAVTAPVMASPATAVTCLRRIQVSN
jgi:hypothetical protein